MTQVHLAKILGVNQAAVSKLECRAEMYVSTLQSFVKAMGGELKITARFLGGRWRLINLKTRRRRGSRCW